MRLYIGIRNTLATLMMTATLAPCAIAQRHEARVHAESAPGGTTIGDPIRIVISVDHPSGSIVAWPDSTTNVKPFEFAGFESGETIVTGDISTSSGIVVVRAFETGELTFPSLTMPIVSASGDSASVTTAQLPVAVQSVGLDSSGDIRAIKPPLGIPIGLSTVLRWLLVFAIVTGLAYALYRRFRKTSEDTDVHAPPEPALPPHVIAYRALDALERSDLLGTSQIRQWYSEASAIIRVYIEGRYHIPAMELASVDIMRKLESIRLDFEAMEQFRDFFGRADLVKFAKHRPTHEQCVSLLGSARTLVDVTRDDPTAPESAPPARNTTAA